MIVVERVLEHGLEDEVLAPRRVLRVVHRAHVQRARPRAAARAGRRSRFSTRHAERAGRVVDDHVADLGADRLGDRAEVLDLVARRAVGPCGRGCGSSTPPSSTIRRASAAYSLGRVGDRRALLAIGERARDRAGDDDGVVEAQGASPWKVGSPTSHFCGRPPCGQAERFAPTPVAGESRLESQGNGRSARPKPSSGSGALHPMSATPRSLRPTTPRMLEHVRRELARRRVRAAAPASGVPPQSSTNEKPPAQG